MLKIVVRGVALCAALLMAALIASKGDPAPQSPPQESQYHSIVPRGIRMQRSKGDRSADLPLPIKMVPQDPPPVRPKNGI